jgi:CDGSH-type Zn-finger protein
MAHEKLQARVVVAKNGPYIVTGSVPLSKQTIGTDADGGSEAWRESGSFPPAEKYALCRCGHSKKKPFCDGTHAKIGFDGTETASRAPYIEQAKAIQGPAMVLTDADNLCAFARFAIRTEKCGRKCRAPTIQQSAPCSCGKSTIVRPGASWPGTKRHERRSSATCRFRSD